MKWLTFDEAIASHFCVRGTPKPQSLEFQADMVRLPQDIPTPPQYEEEGYGCASPANQWFGVIDERCVVVEQEAPPCPYAPDRALVHTSYLEQQDRQGDWTVLLDLGGLPHSISVSRPRFIDSRYSKPECVVYRPSGAGWDSTVYKASSTKEAEDLLAFLKADEWNIACFIGPPEIAGLWSVIEEREGREHILATYPFRNGTLSVGCGMSAKMPERTLTVRNREDDRSEVFRIVSGHVQR